MSDTDRVVQRNFSLYPRQLDTLIRIAERFEETGSLNLSQALRYVINQFEKGEKSHAEATGAGDCSTVSI